MAKKFKDHVVRDKPKKRGSRQHKKSLNKNEKGRSVHDVTRAKVKAKGFRPQASLYYLSFHT